MLLGIVKYSLLITIQVMSLKYFIKATLYIIHQDQLAEAKYIYLQWCLLVLFSEKKKLVHVAVASGSEMH